MTDSSPTQAAMQWRRSPASGSHGLAWAVAWSFMAGSALFALGSFPAYSQGVDPGVVGATFVVGSVFFTAAAYGQLLQVDAGRGGRRHVWRWRPDRRDWWSAMVQLVGTVLFNINTVRAMQAGLSAEETNRLVWAPDIFGSIAFLVASHLAWVELCKGVWCVRRDDAVWWSCGVNYVGSIFFMVSAIAAFTLPTTGQTLNTALVNSATFAGAIAFFLGAYLLLPPMRPRRHEEPRRP